MSFAEIVLDHKSSNLDKPFTYNIPTELEYEVEIGVRVAVPFGRYNKPTMGIIIGKSESTKVTGRIKDIIEVLDDKPLITANGLALAKWIKSEYLCTSYESMQPILPPGDFRDLVTIVEPGAKYNVFIPNTDMENRILEMTKDSKRVYYSDLKKALGKKDFNKTLENLKARDVLKLTLEIKRTNSVKYESVVEVNKELSYVQGIEKIGNKAKKQIQVWGFLKDSKFESVKKVLEKNSTSLSVLKSMEKKGLVTFGKRETKESPNAFVKAYDKITLNPEQEGVFKDIWESVDRSHLIQGITGSGKTEIYLQLVEKALEIGKDSIILVPEISLTPQTIDRFVGRFGNKVAILHSKLTQSERFDQWRRIKEGEYKIVVGARSALFAPFGRLGLIVIDEEHENTYKSSNNPKYNAIDVAVKIASMSNAKLVLGTATPSMETYYRAVNGEYKLHVLKSRATANTLPEISIIDMREELYMGNRSIFSSLLYTEMEAALDLGNQVILFLNRRGYSGFMTCRSCGYVEKCKNCDISLTHHKSTNRLRCHYCGETKPIPKACPSCGSKYFKSFGIGTERIEEEVSRLFPRARVLRMDSDSIKTREDYESSLNAMKSRRIDVLIGTQMISKGLDFPDVTLVGIIAADTTLNLPDFRSPERTYQLVTQVSGRAGRGDSPGKVVLQTYNPQHYSLVTAVKGDYREFYGFESELRREFSYPPYTNISSITIFGKDQDKVKSAMEKSSIFLRELLVEENLVDVTVLGPNPAPLERINNNYRWQILLKFGYNNHVAIRNIIDRVYNKDESKIKSDDLKVSIDINPNSIL